MIDFAALLYAPTYRLLAVEATLQTEYRDPVAVRVINKTAGVQTTDGRTGLATIKPAAAIQVADLTALGLKRADLRKARLVMGGKTWRIESTLPKPSPAGEADGELLLFLSEQADCC